MARGFVEHERIEAKKRMEEAEVRFRAAIDGRARDLEWRSALERPTDYVAREARAADLIVTGSNRDDVLIDRMRPLDPSDLVMVAGRPLFLVPPGGVSQVGQRAGRLEGHPRGASRGRRALPLLHKAKDVTVLEIVEGDASTTRRRIASKMSQLGSSATMSWPSRK